MRARISYCFCIDFVLGTKVQNAFWSLKDHGMKKINFSGGEPFLNAEALGKLCRFCKEVLKLESVTVVN